MKNFKSQIPERKKDKYPVLRICFLSVALFLFYGSALAQQSDKVNAALAKADTNASSRLVFDYNLNSGLPSLEEQVDYTLLAGTLEK